MMYKTYIHKYTQTNTQIRKKKNIERKDLKDKLNLLRDAQLMLDLT